MDKKEKFSSKNNVKIETLKTCYKVISLFSYSKNTNLQFQEEKNEKKIIPYCTDADFIIPNFEKPLNQENFEDMMIDYIYKSEYSSCNLRQGSEDSIYVAIKKIHQGDELTFRKGINDWLIYLLFEVKFLYSPFNNDISPHLKSMSNADRDKMYHDIIHAFKEVKINYTKKFPSEFKVQKNTIELLKGLEYIKKWLELPEGYPFEAHFVYDTKKPSNQDYLSL